MTTENIDIRIREDGSRVVRRDINRIGTDAKSAANQVDFLKNALRALLGVLAVDRIRQYADAWSSAAGLISIATKSSEEAVAVTQRLFEVAQRTRTGYSDVVELYGRAARAGKELGASQEQIIKFTDGVGKSLAIQHTSATQAQGALLQLGQALGGGKIQAQEYNSLLDGLPVVLQIVAKNMEGTGGSVAALTKRVKDGEVTSKEFFDAFLKGSGDLDEAFGKSSQTISQGMTVINNALTKYVGELDHAIGLSATFGKIAKFVADNVDVIATSVIALGVAVAVAFAPGYLLAFAASLARLFVLLNANPVVALASAVAGLAVYFAQLGDSILLGTDSLTTVNDLFRAFGDTAKYVLLGVQNLFTDVFGAALDFVKGVFTSIDETAGNSISGWIDSFGQFYSGLGTGFAGILRAVAKTFDAIGGLVLGLLNLISNVIGGIPRLFAEVFSRAYNAVVDTIEKMINVIIGGINSIRAYIGKGPLELVDFTRLEVDRDAFQKYGESVANSFQVGFDTQGDFLQKSLENVFEKADKFAAARIAAENAKKTNPADLSIPIGKPNAIGIDPKEVNKAENALRSLLNTILPSSGAVLELAKAQRVLNEAQKVGLITSEQNARYYALAKRYYEDQINPLGAINRELNEQIELLGFNNREREIEGQLLSITKDLQRQGIDLTMEESKALKEKLTTLQMMNLQVQAQDQLLASTVGERENFIRQINAIATALADPSTGFSAGDAAQSIFAIDPELFANTQTALDAQAAAFEAMYAKIDLLRQKDLISEETANAVRMKLDTKQVEIKLQNASTFFGNMASLSKSGNSKLAAIGKAAAIAQATIQGYVAVQNALAVQPYPVGVALAAAAGVMAAQNIAAIMKQGYESGGYTGNMGTKQVAGVVHGQEFVVNADATARHRPLLESLNSGSNFENRYVAPPAPAAVAPAGGGSNNVRVIVNNNAGEAQVTQEERDGPQGREIEITFERLAAKSVRKGGVLAEAIEGQYGLNRSQGATY